MVFHLFQAATAQVVLVHFCWSVQISLSLKEVTYPQYRGHVLMYSSHFGFSGACSVDSLSFCQAIDDVFSKRCLGTSVTSHVVMNGKCCIDKLMILVQVRSLNCQAQKHGSADVLVHTGQFIVVVVVCFVFSDSLSYKSV